MIVKSILDTDLYKFTTSYAYMKLFPHAMGTFEFFDRDNTEYTEEFVQQLRMEIVYFCSLHLTQEEQDYMTTHCRFIPPMYWEWLSGIKLSSGKVSIWLDEDKHLHITAKDYLYRVTLYEVPILAIVSELRNRMLNNTINMTDVLIRLEPKIVLSNQNQMHFSEFRTRRRYSYNVQEAIVKSLKDSATYCTGTSNCYLAMKYDMPMMGRSLPIKNKSDEFDVSELVGQVFCDDFKVVNLLNMYQHVNQSVYDGEGTLGTPISKGNIQARLRMIYLYNLASIHKGLVMSTDNQTEYQLGFWTIHGDVGDFDPIQGLWKTEVYELAKWLIGYYYGCGIKKEVDADGARKICDMCEAIKKSMSLTPTDGLGISNSDLDQIGAKSYYDVDRVLQTLTCKASPENDKLQDELTTELGPDVVGKITGRRFKSRFKRLVSPIIVPREMYD